MVFSSIPFLYYFLPIVLIAYFLVPRKAKNYVLLLASLFFYFYGEQLLVLLMLSSALVDYSMARIIEKFRDNKIIPKIALAFTLLFDLGVLCYFKYVDFFISNFNAVFGMEIPLLKIALPLGISFYTFQTLSYVLDVYRGDVEAQKNFFTYATYLTLFPQLVAGPIVRYKTVAHELLYREHSVSKFSQGVFRFSIGMGKKIMIANMLGEFVNAFSSIQNPTVLLCWLFAAAYSLQIYFDFSGYSDMAIGLGKMFGFEFNENFDHPYTSKSISEFWRRWHMSLGSWFRDYIYIPLGGNRVKFPRWLLNVFVVWFATGLWHGASWNFVLWGVYFGVFLVLEKLFLGNLLKKLPGFVSNAYVIIVVFVSFVMFGCMDYLGGFNQGLQHIASMFGFGGLPFASTNTLYYLRDYAVVLVLAIIGSTPFVKNLANKVVEKYPIAKWAQPVIVVLIFLLCTAELSDASFNPFLYFNF
ncbi:MAG: MBOAT family protein [Clostridia bacterium]|nr:MBOAT family protein [Clostridia bacterium]